MKKYMLWFGLCVCLALNVGCDPFGVVAGVQPESVERWRNVQVQPGDYWTYHLSRTYDDGEVYVGEFTYRISNETITDLVGQTAWVIDTESIWGPEGATPETFVSKDYRSQDAEGTWHLHGSLDGNVDDEDAYDYFVVAEDGGSYVTLPNPAIIGAPCDWDVTFDDGYTNRGQGQVVGHEEVTIGLGTFQTARIEYERITEWGNWTTTYNTVVWVLPEVAKAIKVEVAQNAENSESGEVSSYTQSYELIDCSLLNK